MGLTQVLIRLPEIISNFKTVRQEILNFKPDAVILIDYPGFNLRMAKWARSKNFKVYYYISPKAWAWNKKRVFTIRDNVVQYDFNGDGLFTNNLDIRSIMLATRHWSK